MVDESYTDPYKKRPIVYAFVYKLQPATKIRAKQKARTFIRAISSVVFVLILRY